MHAIKKWLKGATPKEKRDLAWFASISGAYLYQLSVGLRNASADVAASIETASKYLHKLTKGKTKLLKRGEISKTCAECPYYKKCNK